MIRVKNLTYSHADVQHLNLLGTWLYMEAHTIVMTVPSNSIFHFLYYVLVFINSSSKQRKLSYLEQLKMLSRNLQLIFYFSFERQISSEKQDIQSTSSVMQHTLFKFISGKQHHLFSALLVIFCRSISWHVSLFSYFQRLYSGFCST